MSLLNRPLLQPASTPPDQVPIRIDNANARRLVWRTMFSCPRLTIPAAILLILHQFCEALVPVVMGRAIDQAISTGDSGALLTWIVVLAVVFLALSTTFRFGSRLGYLAVNTVGHRLRSAVTDRILDPRGMAGPQRSAGTLLSIATSDVMRLAMTVSLGLYPVAELAAVVFCGAMLLSISWPLGLAILIAAPLLLWFMDVVGAPLRRRSEHEQQRAGEAAGSAADLMTGYRVIAGMAAQPEAAHRYRQSSRRALTAVVHARRAEGAFLVATGLFTSLLVVGVGVAAGLLAVHGSISVGQLIAVVGLTIFVIAPLSMIGANLGAVWASGLASAQRVLGVLTAPPAVTTGDRPAPQPDGTGVSIRGLTQGDIDGLDLDIAAPGMTVITGAGGDLAAVLSRAVRPDAGTVLVNGTDLFDIAYPDVLTLLRVAPHSADLFTGSVIDNVAGGSMVGDSAGEETAADLTRVDRSLLAAGADDLADILPDGLDTDVGESGRFLSGGQRQRVALARALAADTDYLVLVDPTTAVDSVTESMIAARIAELRRDRATIVLTDSPAFLAVADRVVAL